MIRKTVSECTEGGDSKRIATVHGSVFNRAAKVHSGLIDFDSYLLAPTRNTSLPKSNRTTELTKTSRRAMSLSSVAALLRVKNIKLKKNKTRRRPTLEGQLNHSSSSLNVLGVKKKKSLFMNERNELNESRTRAGQLRDEQVKYAAKKTVNILFFFLFTVDVQTVI